MLAERTVGVDEREHLTVSTSTGGEREGAKVGTACEGLSRLASRATRLYKYNPCAYLLSS